jgi:hypothetical protein
MKKCSVSLALVGLLLFATIVSAKNNVHVNSIDMNSSEPDEGRVVYADMKMTTSDASSEPTPAPSTSSSD